MKSPQTEKPKPPPNRKSKQDPDVQTFLFIIVGLSVILMIVAASSFVVLELMHDYFHSRG